MCGGGCSLCFEQQMYEMQQHDEERAQYERAMEREYYERAEAEYYEEMWWNEWLTMHRVLSKPSSLEVF